MAPNNRPYHLLQSGSSLVGEVRLYEQTWSVHIHPRHQNVPYDGLIAAVQDPCLITDNNGRPGSFVFVNEFARDHHGNPLVVPVGPSAEGTAIVKTAYFTGTMPGTIIWRRGDG